MQKQMRLKKMNKGKLALEDKREHQKKIVNLMIGIYCRGNKHVDEGICTSCNELIAYSNMRVDKCPFMETKTFCEQCNVHCFKRDMRARIREVMRYSGPRMLLHHPILTIQHGIESYKDKRRRRRENI